VAQALDALGRYILPACDVEKSVLEQVADIVGYAFEVGEFQVLANLGTQASQQRHEARQRGRDPGEQRYRSSAAPIIELGHTSLPALVGIWTLGVLQGVMVPLDAALDAASAWAATTPS